MAVFNPDNQSGEPTNFTGRSQGVPANRAGEVLAEGAASVLGGLAAAKDFNIRQDIRQDVDDVFNVTNAAFLNDEKTGFDTVANKDLVPAEFRALGDSFRGDIAKLIEARDQGALTDTHYYSMLASSMKNIKSKYPGYHDVVDNIFQSVTGVQPANAVRRSILAEVEAEENRARQGQSDFEKKFWEMKEWWGEKYGDYVTNPGKYAGMEMEILEYAVKQESEAKYVTAASNRLNLEVANGKADAEVSGRLYKEVIDKTAMNILDLGSAGFKNKEELLAKLTSGTLSTKEQEGLLLAIGQAELAFDTKVEEYNAQNPYVQTVEDRDEVVERARARVSKLKDYITNADWGSLARHYRIHTSEKARRVLDVLESNPDVARLETLREIAPEALNTGAGVTLMTNAAGIVRDMGEEVLYGVASGNIGITTLLEGLQDRRSALSPEDQSNLATYVIKQLKTFVPKMTPDQVAEFVRKNFTGDNPPMERVKEYLAGDDESMAKFYVQIVNPQLAQAIIGSGDQMAIDQYVSFAASMLDDIPEVGRAFNRIQESSSDPEQPIIYQWDPQNNQMMVIANNDYANKLRLNGSNASPEMVQRQMALMLKKASKNINTVNGVIANFNVVAQAAGIDSGAYLREMLKDRGVVIQENAGEAAPEGKSPFEESDPKDGSDTGQKQSRIQTSTYAKVVAWNNSLDDEESIMNFEWTEEDDDEVDIDRSLMGYAANRENEALSALDAMAGASGTLVFANEGQDKIQPHFRSALEKTSSSLGIPLKINSGYRSSAYNRKVRGVRGSRHIAGDAADISMRGMNEEQRKELVRTLIKNGVSRFITYSRSPDMIHVDMLDTQGLYFMHDKSKRNINRAPQWLKDVMDERKLSMSDTDARLEELYKKYELT